MTTCRLPAATLLLLFSSAVPAVAQSAPPLDPAMLSTVAATLGLNTEEKCPVTLNPDGSLCVVVSGKDVLLGQGESVLLAPPAPDASFEHARSLLVVNRKIVGEQSTLNGSNPSFRVDMEETGTVAKRIAVVGENTFRKQVDLLTCTLHRGSGSSLPQLAFKVKDGKLVLSSSGPKLKAVYVFVGTDYAGALVGNPSTLSVDLKTVPAGQYALRTVSETEDGAIASSVPSSFSVSPRFRVICSATTESFGVEKDTTTVPVQVECVPGSGVSNFDVYLDNKKIGDGNRSGCKLTANLAEVYSGNAELTMVGKDNDGVPIPPETAALKVQNYFLNSAPLTQNLQADVAKLAELDQQIQYWYTKAINERDSVTVTRTSTGSHTEAYDANSFAQNASVGYLTRITVVPGRQGEYLANCKKAIVERAQVRFRVAQAYKQMGRLIAFKRSCLQIVREAGASSALGRSALQLMAGS